MNWNFKIVLRITVSCFCCFIGTPPRGLAAGRSLMAVWFPTTGDGERIEPQALTGTISPNGIVRLRVGVSQITGRPGSCGWSLQCRSVA